MRKWNSMKNVISFRLSPCSILIDQYNSPPYPTHDQRVRCSRTDQSAPHNTCFHSISSFTILSTPPATPRHQFQPETWGSPTLQHIAMCCRVDVPVVWITRLRVFLRYRSHPLNNR